MNSSSFDFKGANKNLIWVVLVGLALGVANFALGAWPTIGQSLFQHLVTSLIIGYGLLFICFNEAVWFSKETSDIKKYAILLLLFIVLGVLASEIEILVRRYVFQQKEFKFLGGGGLYFFNGILSAILGFMTYTWVHLRQRQKEILPSIELVEESQEPPISNIPIRQGETTTLHEIEKVIFFEAYDNYSFLHDLDGNKFLCNYSLAFLEKKLDQNFIRVHRKHLINKIHIHKIKPHLKGRYSLEFKDKKRTSIISAASYSDVIKSIVKL